MTTETLNLLPPAARGMIAAFTTMPETLKVVSGVPSVPTELQSVMELGKKYVANVSLKLLTVLLETARQGPQRGKVYAQFTVPVEINGVAGLYKGWLSDLDAFVAAAKSGKITVTRVESENAKNPEKPYQNLQWVQPIAKKAAVPDMEDAEVDMP
jgi:hypothetical protein